MAVKSITFTGATTDGAILDPTAGSRFVLTKLMISMTGTAEVTIYDEADASATQIVDQRITDGLVLEWHYDDVPWTQRHPTHRKLAVPPPHVPLQLPCLVSPLVQTPAPVLQAVGSLHSHCEVQLIV